MPVSALSAARSLCEMSGWTISNLKLQKVLYLAHMYHLGKTGRPLIDENFQAWEYGPVVADVYRQAKGFGNGPVRNVFHWFAGVPTDSEEYSSLSEAYRATQNMSAGQLVSLTHWPKGAWYKCYSPEMRGIVIPNTNIMEEYRARQSA